MNIVKIKRGSIINSHTEVIVNSWNTNILPWFLLLPQGVSKAIKKRTGIRPFNDLFTKGYLAPGTALLTSGGKLEPQKIIHVSALKMTWTSNPTIIRNCVKNALKLAQEQNFKSIAFPLIGSGTGGVNSQIAQEIIMEELKNSPLQTELYIL